MERPSKRFLKFMSIEKSLNIIRDQCMRPEAEVLETNQDRVRFEYRSLVLHAQSDLSN